jgi:hypothetical protein
MSRHPRAFSAADDPVPVPYTVNPTRASSGSAATSAPTARFAASIRGPGASACFIEPDASSTTMTGVVSLGVAGGGTATAGAAPGTRAGTSASAATATERRRSIGPPFRSMVRE